MVLKCLLLTGLSQTTTASCRALSRRRVSLELGPMQAESGLPASSAEFFAVMGSLSATTQGTVTSLFEIGALFGSLATMIFGNQLGRIRISLISSIIVVIGAVLQASSYGVAQIIVGRIVTGLGIGGLTSTAPVYLSECTKAVDRGSDVAKMLTTLIVSSLRSVCECETEADRFNPAGYRHRLLGELAAFMLVL